MNLLNRLLAKFSFAGQKKLRIMRQMQRLIHAGVPITQSLYMLQRLYSKDGRKPKEPLALMIGEWRTRLDEGKSLSYSMRGWINVSEEMIIEAGEQSEKLAGSLEDAVQASGASSAIRNAILMGLAYPAVLFAALCFMLYGFSVEIVPTFATIVPPEEWTGNAAIMYSVSQFVVNWSIVVLMALGGLVTAIFISFPILTGTTRKYLDYLPPWSIYKVTQGASFMISMRGFIAAGLPIPEAMRRMIRSGNPYFRERVGSILARVNAGRNLGQAMTEAGHNFPDNEISGEVSIYAGLDNFAESLDLLAKEWITNSINRAQVSSKVLNNLMLVVLAGVIGFIALSMFELQDLITQSARN